MVLVQQLIGKQQAARQGIVYSFTARETYQDTTSSGFISRLSSKHTNMLGRRSCCLLIQQMEEATAVDAPLLLQTVESVNSRSGKHGSEEIHVLRHILKE